MRIALAQISPYLGDVEKNFRLHLKYIEKAKKKNADLIIFPELSLTGYTLKDLVENVALNHEKDRFFGQLKTLSKEISIVLGFVEEKERGLFYNSGAFLSRGKILHVHRKVFLPTYGMFEEGKYFGQGKNFNTFTTPYGNTGMMICYDFLHYSASYCLFAGGTEIIIVISAAPGRGISDKEFYTTSHMWELMGKTISRFSSAFLVYCNRTGFEDGKSFAGGSFIYNPAGELIAKASYVDEDFLIKEINLDEIRTIRKKWPYKRDDKPEIILEVLKRIVRKYED
ncbi:MAG: nitrilase [Candidatus Aminicenantes bacterium]|nr:nitrilase [Candidatus Aminicenantes bacterium]